MFRSDSRHRSAPATRPKPYQPDPYTPLPNDADIREFIRRCMRRFKHVCDMFKTSSWARANAASYFFKDQRRRLDQISIDLGIENKAATSPEWRFEAVGMENWLVATKHLLPMLDQVLYRVLEILMTEGQSKGLKTGFYWNKWLPYCEHYIEEYMNDLVRFCRLLKDKEQEKREREKEAREKRMQGRRRWGN